MNIETIKNGKEAKRKLSVNVSLLADPFPSHPMGLSSPIWALPSCMAWDRAVSGSFFCKRTGRVWRSAGFEPWRVRNHSASVSACLFARHVCLPDLVLAKLWSTNHFKITFWSIHCGILKMKWHKLIQSHYVYVNLMRKVDEYMRNSDCDCAWFAAVLMNLSEIQRWIFFSWVISSHISVMQEEIKYVESARLSWSWQWRHSDIRYAGTFSVLIKQKRRLLT